MRWLSLVSPGTTRTLNYFLPTRHGTSGVAVAARAQEADGYAARRTPRSRNAKATACGQSPQLPGTAAYGMAGETPASGRRGLLRARGARSQDGADYACGERPALQNGALRHAADARASQDGERPTHAAERPRSRNANSRPHLRRRGCLGWRVTARDLAAALPCSFSSPSCRQSHTISLGAPLLPHQHGFMSQVRRQAVSR